MTADERGANRDYDWDAFDSEAYLGHYYEQLHPDDAELARRTAVALRDAQPADRLLDVVDVGTGPNLFPLLCALPRARSLTAWEYSAGNIDWLRAELAAAGTRAVWQRYWEIVRTQSRSGAALPPEPLPALARVTRLVQSSIFDLPVRQWDAATMFFCAESITRDAAEFARACAAFASSVRSGGRLIAAFLSGSAGYEVAARAFPALPVSAVDIETAFGPVARSIVIEPVGGTAVETHSGYSGALFMTATAL